MVLIPISKQKVSCDILNLQSFILSHTLMEENVSNVMFACLNELVQKSDNSLDIFIKNLTDDERVKWSFLLSQSNKL